MKSSGAGLGISNWSQPSAGYGATAGDGFGRSQAQQRENMSIFNVDPASMQLRQESQIPMVEVALRPAGLAASPSMPPPATTVLRKSLKVGAPARSPRLGFGGSSRTSRTSPFLTPGGTGQSAQEFSQYRPFIDNIWV